MGFLQVNGGADGSGVELSVYTIQGTHFMGFNYDSTGGGGGGGDHEMAGSIAVISWKPTSSHSLRIFSVS